VVNRKTKGTNMQIVILAILALLLTGSDNRFSENKNAVYSSTGNKISDKCVGGGICVADYGIYIDPFVEKNNANGEIVLLGFHIMNRTPHTSMGGGINELGLIREVTFRLPDGQIINLKATNQENNSGDISYNNIGKFASYEQVETGMIEISKDSFKKLVSAQRLSCKISGSSYSAIYEEDEIESEFLENLKKFYDSYLK
jgi:hypothetical protein